MPELPITQKMYEAALAKAEAAEKKADAALAQLAELQKAAAPPPTPAPAPTAPEKKPGRWSGR
jgi:hypothetical protein